MLVVNLTLYIIAFLLLWYGSGLIVSATNNFSKKLRITPFTFSFIFLGLLTSIPEFSVGLQAIIDHNGEIFVGNLLGGIVVLFLVVIPVLAVVGNGISLKHDLNKKTLLMTLLVILEPAVCILDKKVTNFEGVICILLYIFLLVFIERKHGIFDHKNNSVLNLRAYSYKDILKIVLGIGIVFIASNLIVDKTIYFGDFFRISTFYISLIVIALGTDLPELSLAIRSTLSGKKDIAMGDYIGAAAASTLLFGIFTLLHNGEVLTVSNFLVTFIFISLALSAFYLLSLYKQHLSRRNAFLLLGLYAVFLYVEIMK
jgi:cation:H+ antiporter